MSYVLQVEDLCKKYENYNFEKVIFNLDHITFSLKKGEVLGISGNNGSGKSTLLKLLSGITKPSKGKIKYTGKMFSVLELGAGFHPDVSGYENIFINAQLNGISKQDIKEKLDDIVDFSGLKDYINLPIKSYSNGMYLRLAMSIALIFDFDIIIIDEVINVGDKVFQEKTYNALKTKVTNGTTMVIATHDTGFLLKLCNKVLLLNDGKTKYYGELNNEILQKYWWQETPLRKKTVKKEKEASHFSSIQIEFYGKTLYKNNDIELRVSFNSHYNKAFIFSVVLIDVLGNNVLSLCSELSENKVCLKGTGEFLCKIKIPKNILNYGNYKISAFFSDEKQNDIQHFNNVGKLEISLSKKQREGGEFVGKYSGSVYPLVSWRIKSSSFK